MTAAAQPQPTIPPGYKQTEVGIIPEDWEVKRLGDIFSITSSKRVFQRDWRDSGIPFYRARELAVLGETGRVDNELFISATMYKSYKDQYGVPQVGDMLVTGVGTLGKTYVVRGDHDFYFKDGNIIWFQIGCRVNAFFLRQLYLTPLIERQIQGGSSGTTVGTYTITGAKKTVVPVPTLAEQEAIAGALSDADAWIESLEKLIGKKRAIKQGSMQALLTPPGHPGHQRLPGFKGEWEVKRLGEICSMMSGEAITSDSIDESSQYPCYGGNGLRGYTSRFTHRGQYALVGRQGALCGNVVGVEGEFFASEHAVVVTALPCTDIGWLTFVLGRMALNQYSESSAQPGLSVSKILQLEVSAPLTKAEQSAIAAVLSDMDAEIEALEAKLAKARQIKQGMMQELLTGRVRLV